MLDKISRYGEIRRLLGDHPQGTILEVGAGPLGLGACLPYRFVGVDPWYPEPPIAAQQAVMGSGLTLPFGDRSFDHVLCIETLEHVPEDQRTPMVAEMCRVSRQSVIITHPYGKWARLGDHVLNLRYTLLRALGKAKPWWLIEHLQQPYPEPKRYLPTENCGFSASVYGQENAFLHVEIVFFGTLKIVSRRTERVFAQNPDKLFRRLRWADFPPYCRKIVVLKREKSL